VPRVVPFSRGGAGEEPAAEIAWVAGTPRQGQGIATRHPPPPLPGRPSGGSPPG
jgi:hypothetical protein